MYGLHYKMYKTLRFSTAECIVQSSHPFNIMWDQVVFLSIIYRIIWSPNACVCNSRLVQCSHKMQNVYEHVAFYYANASK